ncbi:MAG: Wzy polymerase domain-containing protein [Polaromonas sp.]|nr:Wzy polymerase domain-containing protein [Polaromonas sp.]
MSPVNSRYLPSCGLGALLILPWLNACTAGPTPNTWPWLISALCALLLWIFKRSFNSQLIVLTWVLAASLSALVGLVQYFGFSSILSPWVSFTQGGDAFANLRQRNQFATLTSIGLVALLARLAMREKLPAFRQAWRTPWWAGVLAVLLALGNAASSSRTGLLQWLLIPLLTAWWALPGRRQLLALALALQALLAYGIAVFALPWLLALSTGAHSGGLFGRLATDAGCSSRKVLWSNVLTLISQKPWLGWGWGELDYAHFITLYPGERFCEILDNAHNLPLHLAVELGVPAALALCGGAAWLVLRARPWCETDPARRMAWGVLAVIGLHSLLEYPLWYGPFQIAAGLCVLILWRGAGACVSPGGQPLTLRLSGQIMRALLAGFLMSLWTYAAWDYHRISQIYLQPEARDPAYRDDTLNKIRNSWLFSSQVQFAELSVTPLARENAQWTFDTASVLLHYSPEPRLIEKLVESAVMLGRDQDALAYLIRYQAAFPQDHARWARENAIQPPAR